MGFKQMLRVEGSLDVTRRFYDVNAMENKQRAGTRRAWRQR